MFDPTPAMAGWFGYPLELDDRLRLIKGAGFESVLLWWAVESAYEPSIPKKVETAHKHGLMVENAHLQFANMNSLWLDGAEGEHYCEELMGLVAEAGVYGVPTLVVHLTRTSEPPASNELGFSRFMRLVEVAERANVDLAFENLKVVSRLYEMMARSDSSRVGVCFDAGHNHYVCPGTRICRDFAPRIKAVHLHDNRGNKDEHLIPYDGNEDWANVAKELIDSAYTGAWSLEIEHPLTDKFGKALLPREEDPYFGMGPEEYLARAFAAHRRLVEEAGALL
ncbi:MAG: sugar phosphate isomerase/epimerase [Clostridiales bacterium]|nr:sugar phosphate isomerase/epimerase [Clostridiales bacterium]